MLPYKNKSFNLTNGAFAFKENLTDSNITVINRYTIKRALYENSLSNNHINLNLGKYN